MGFPLDRGSVEDGILTCHWHHARFDLASGCTFDLWADDVPTCPVEVRGRRDLDQAVVRLTAIRRAIGAGGSMTALPTISGSSSPRPYRGNSAPACPRARSCGRPRCSRCATAMAGESARRSSPRSAICCPVLPEEETYLALFHGARRVAADCDGAGAAPGARAAREPARSRHPPALAAALERRAPSRSRRTHPAHRHRHWCLAGRARRACCSRRRRTAPSPTAGTSLDFINKACECLDLIGWEHARPCCRAWSARWWRRAAPRKRPLGAIRSTLSPCARKPPRNCATCSRRPAAPRWSDHAALAAALLGDDPRAILEALKAAVRAGALPADLGRSLAYAAALRVARFGTANEHADWETALHVFTYANAIHQVLKRIGARTSEQTGGIEAVRGVLHGAMAVYLARYLNVPPARLPGEGGDRLDDLPDSVEDIRAALLEAFDRQRQVDAAGRLVARHLTLGHPPNALSRRSRSALLREDAGFHAYQMLEAGVRQFGEWGNADPGRHILIAVARYLAAHSPTERAALQTADIAQRLLRGGELHQEK